MKQTLISYVIRRQRSEENARLIGDVFNELRQTSPSGLQYLVARRGRTILSFHASS